MPLKLSMEKKVDKKVGLLRFKKINNAYLLTNEVGEYTFITPSDFDNLVFQTSKLKNTQLYAELCEKGFVKNDDYLDRLVQKYTQKTSFFNEGTVLHIIVATLRCNNRCSYCQTSAGTVDDKNLDMPIEIAKSVVDRIFETPNNSIIIEFQGGEPLMNFDTLKFIISYAKEKNSNAKKSVKFTLVSNLALLTDDKLKFLIEENVSICTSLDGPKILHNKNRISLDKKKDSYDFVVEGLRKINAYRGNIQFKPNALLTVTKDSLKYPKEIVDEYVKAGLDKIFLRPLNIFNFSKKRKKFLQYSPFDFLKFYKSAMDYIFELNLKGINLQECTSCIFLLKILKGIDLNFLDMRSPCGAAIGQLAYDYDGDVYTCDEGRMLGRIGNDSFKLGSVKTHTHADFLASPTVKAMCIASCLDNLPGCVDCVYKPYCGVCPLMRYAENGNIFTSQPRDSRCIIHSGVLDYLFEKIQDMKHMTMFNQWINLT